MIYKCFHGKLRSVQHFVVLCDVLLNRHTET